MWFARAGFPPGTRAKTRFWRPTTRSGWAPFLLPIRLPILSAYFEGLKHNLNKLFRCQWRDFPLPPQVPPIRNRRSPESPRLWGFFLIGRRLAGISGNVDGDAGRVAFHRPRIDPSPHALPPRHLEHQLGQAPARSRPPLRQGGEARSPLPARDQMHRGKLPRARARRARFSPHRGRGPEGLSWRRHAFAPPFYA